VSKSRPSHSTIQSVYRRDNYQCQNCKQKGGSRGSAELHAHHIVALKDGGSNNESNLITLCESCHKAIHTDQKAPTAKNSDDPANPELWQDVIASSVWSAGLYPRILMSGVVLVALTGIGLGFAIDSMGAVLSFIAFSIFAGIFVWIIQYEMESESEP
jgi:hypothetical protein